MKMTKKIKVLKKLRKELDSIEGEKGLGTLEDMDVKIEKTNLLLGKVRTLLEDISEDNSKIKKVEITNPPALDKTVKVKNLTEIKFPTKIKVINFPEQKAQKEQKEIKVNNLSEIKVPSEVKILNFPKQKEINIPDFPKEISIKKPKWYSPITENNLLVLLQSIADYTLKKLSIMKFKGDLEEYKNKKNSLAVRLVDSKGNEYTAISNLVGGGGGLNQKETTDAIDNSSLLTLIKDKIIQLLFHNGHLKVLGYLDSIGHGTTNTDVRPECAVGKKTGIETGAFTLLESSSFVQPVGDTQMYLQSTDAEDSAGGDGIEEITIEYFPLAWGARKTVKVIPDGANQVTISVDDIYRIHKVYGNDGHPAAGDITITNDAENVLYGQIDQYDTFMRRCIFYIAQDEKVSVTQFIVGSTTSGGVNVSLFATHEDEDGDLITRGCATVEVADNTAIGELKPWLTIENTSNVRKSVGLAVNGNLAAQKCTGTLKGFLEKL